MNSIIDLLKNIMGCPSVEQATRDRASELLLKIAPDSHPSRQIWSNLFRDAFG